MATHKRIPETAGAATEAASRAPLSRFEGHCLCRRTRECEELLQLAVLGIEQTRERHAPDTDLREIAEHLTEAERHVEIARRLAARWSE
jgi:hypothetical protein